MSPSLRDIALASYPHWGVELSEAPSIDSALTGGLTNRAYLIAAGEQKYVLRIHHPHQVHLGIDRDREARILAAVSRCRIGPKLLYLSPDHRFSVLEYIEGRAWSQHHWRRHTQLSALHDVIDVYRGLSIDLPVFDYVEHLNTYWKRFAFAKPRQVRRLAKDFQRFMKRLAGFLPRASDLALVHHDLVPENIIETADGVRIIDWEYAGLGYAGLDGLALSRMAKRRKYYQVDPFLSELEAWLRVLWLP